jgi:Domain of unknown function (DUF6134)
MRLTVLLFLVCVLATMPASARNLDANFLIIRAGKVIGYHHVDVRETAEGTIVDTEIEMRVKLGPIPLFRYNHDAREIWRDGAIISIVSKTNYNGEKTSVRAHRENGVLHIDGSDYQGPAPIAAIPSSYWDKSLIASTAIINTQTGEIIDVTVENVGETMAPHNVKAEQYRITGTVALDIWYDGPRWVGSHLVIDGEELTYELVADEPQYAALQDYLD